MEVIRIHIDGIVSEHLIEFLQDKRKDFNMSLTKDVSAISNKLDVGSQVTLDIKSAGIDTKKLFIKVGFKKGYGREEKYLESIATCLSDFDNGIFFKFEDFLIKITFSPDRIMILENKFEYLEEMVDKINFSEHNLYDKNLNDELQGMDLLTILLLKQIINDELVEYTADYFLQDKLAYYGYTDVTPKPKNPKKNYREIYDLFLYYVTSYVYGKRRKPKLDIEEIRQYYKLYRYNLLNKYVHEDKDIRKYD